MAENDGQPAGPPSMDCAGHAGRMFIQVMKYTAIGAIIFLA